MKRRRLQKQEKVLVIPWTRIGDKLHPETKSSFNNYPVKKSTECNKGRVPFKTNLLLLLHVALCYFPRLLVTFPNLMMMII
jgi:hypothetical protein